MTEEKCWKCRREYARDNGKKPKCETENKCVYTGKPRIKLSFNETKILNEMYDFLATEEIISKDYEHRQMIIGLAGYYMKLKQEKDGKKE